MRAYEPSNNWKSIEDQLAKALPGQKINLRLVHPAGATLTDFEWILPDTVFKNYTTGVEKGTLEPRDAIVTNEQEVHFYWADPGSKEVKVKYKEDGLERESSPVTIEVAKPASDLIAKGGASVIDILDANFPYLYLLVQNLEFTGQVSIPTDFGPGGKWSFVQIATGNCSAKLDPTDDFPTVKQDGGTYFDGKVYPCAGTFDVGRFRKRLTFLAFH